MVILGRNPMIRCQCQTKAGRLCDELRNGHVVLFDGGLDYEQGLYGALLWSVASEDALHA